MPDTHKPQRPRPSHVEIVDGADMYLNESCTLSMGMPVYAFDQEVLQMVSYPEGGYETETHNITVVTVEDEEEPTGKRSYVSDMDPKG